VIANEDYAIQTITNSTTIVLDTAYRGANVATANIAIQEDPKWIPTGNAAIGHRANNLNKANVYGVDRIEANVPGNKANGIVGPGWLSYTTYTTTQGATRKKAELLVAMSKNFNANATGTLFGDANDGSILKES